MRKDQIIALGQSFVYCSEDNYIKNHEGIAVELVGIKVFDAPIFAFGDGEDPYFNLLKTSPQAIGEHFKTPKEWLPTAKTVISYFLPFSEQVRKANRVDREWPATEWQYGRYEGQMLLNQLSAYLQLMLADWGFATCVPSLSEELIQIEKLKNMLSFTSNWSERHVAFVCGLGTFGLSKGLITKSGVAGRFGSVVTELQVVPDQREYNEIYQHCSMCGACVKRCPVGAITLENGKDHEKCCDYMNVIREKFKPRQGCGKCQVKVSCEARIPAK